MPTKIHWFSLLFLLFCSFPLRAQKKQILQVLESQKNAWNKGDIEGYMQGYWKSDSLVFIGSKGPTFGWTKTLENYKKGYPTTEKMGVLDFSNLQVKMLGRSYALVIGEWKLVRKNDEPHGIFTLVFQNFPSGWKVISDHTE